LLEGWLQDVSVCTTNSQPTDVPNKTDIIFPDSDRWSPSEQIPRPLAELKRVRFEEQRDCHGCLGNCKLFMRDSVTRSHMKGNDSLKAAIPSNRLRQIRGKLEKLEYLNCVGSVIANCVII